jgi:hypothetical protein
VLVASAYVTSIGLEWLRQQLGEASVECVIVTRWSPGDLLSGASDTRACEIAHGEGWQFRVLPGLHAKITLVDDAYLIVGSANLTGAGMSLVPASNREFGIVALAASEDVLAARGLVQDSVLITPDLLTEISAWVNANRTRSPTSPPDFPQSLNNRLVVVPTRLFTAELPWLPAQSLLAYLTGAANQEQDSPGILHDSELFGLRTEFASVAEAHAAIERSLTESRFWRWLVVSVQEQPNGEAWYGTVTSLLHDALLDDPRPYRRDIKTLVTNLYTYVEIFGGPLRADRPNWSQRLTYQP